MPWKFGVIVLFQIIFVWLGTSLASDIIHQTHFVGVKGNMGLRCMDCHMVVLEPGSSRLALDQAACVTCHSPDGRYDGMLDPEIGAFNPANWPENNGESKIFDRNGALRPGKEKWCLGCHDDGTSVIHGIPAPNIAGKYADGVWESPEAAVGGDLKGVPYLLDNDLSTGIKDSKTTDMIFDLGRVEEVSHIRVYSNLTQASQWEVYGSKDLVSWSRILYGQGVIYTKPVWKIEPVKGWAEMRLDRFEPVRYIKLVKILPALLPVNSITEFQIKSDLKYGYLVNGHKIRCDKCHNTASIHVDGVSRTYTANNNNYNAGYRLAKVKVGTSTVDALEIPRVNCNDKQNSRYGNDFALCLSCHDRYKLLGDAYGTGDFFRFFRRICG